MFKNKLIITLVLALAILFAQVGAVAAQGTTAVTGTIQSITIETDANNLTTVLVTLENQGMTETVRLSVEAASTLGLVTIDPVTNVPAVVDEMVGQTITIEAEDILPGEEETAVHPISAILASFFNIEASVIDEYHNDGFGFGLIAQALWMSNNINEDASLAGDILEAKQTGDYSAFFPEGTEDIPTNWGQFKKAVSEKKNNLGTVVSGQADDESNPGSENGQGNGNGQGQNKNKEKNKNKP